ncbi:MAG TPA: PRC-barrel domain-containing protein [Chloroflexota bacterium]
MTTEHREKGVDIGADVLDTHGEKIGTVAYVVVHPPEMHVNELVVSTGAILGRDIVVSLDSVDRVDDGGVHLTITKNEAGRLPDYVEISYSQPPEEWAPSIGYLYPMDATLMPSSAAYIPQPSSVTVNAPQGSVGIHEGMDVESSDGHSVGKVHAVESDGDDITGLVVRHGVLFGHDVRIPASAVAGINEQCITLSMSKDDAEKQFGKH